MDFQEQEVITNDKEQLEEIKDKKDVFWYNPSVVQAHEDLKSFYPESFGVKQN